MTQLDSARYLFISDGIRCVNSNTDKFIEIILRDSVLICKGFANGTIIK